MCCSALASQIVTHCSFSCALLFQDGLEGILCFRAWWNWLCWGSSTFSWCLAKMTHLPVTCSAPSAAKPMGTFQHVAFGRWAGLSWETATPHMPSLISACSAHAQLRKKKPFRTLVLSPPFGNTFQTAVLRPNGTRGGTDTDPQALLVTQLDLYSTAC